MKIEVVASSSSGNCYIVRGARDALILEAGVPIASIKKALKYDLSSLAGCVVSHSHMDHAVAVKDILKLNIEVLSSGGTFEALGLSDVAGSKKIIQTGDTSQVFRMGEFKIRPFEVQHDAPESFGFMIRSEDLKQNIVFATDTFYLKYNFINVHCYMVEANYSREILEENINSGQIHRALAERTTQSHFEINDVIDFLKATDTTKTKAVMLLHPSSSNADTKDFEKRVFEAIGIKTVTAAAGVVLEL